MFNLYNVPQANSQVSQMGVHSTAPTNGEILIDGLGVIPAPSSHTSEEMAKRYAELMQPLLDALNKSTPFTAEDVQKIQSAIKELKMLAQKGLERSGKETSFLTAPMLEDMAAILKTLSQAEFSEHSENTQALTQALAKWQQQADSLINVKARPFIGRNEEKVSLRTLIGLNAITQKTETLPLQDFIALLYVGAANEHYQAALGKLKEMADAGTISLESLNVLKDLSNLVSPHEGFKQRPTSLDPALFDEKLVQELATALHIPTQYMVNLFKESPDKAMAVFIQKMNGPQDYLKWEPGKPVYDFLNSNVFAESKVTPENYKQAWDAMEKIKGQLAILVENGVDPKVQNSMAFFLDQVVKDLEGALGKKDSKGTIIRQPDGSPVMETDPTLQKRALSRWVIDGQSHLSSGQSGVFHNHLQQALRSVQTFNDQQKNELKSQQAVYDEFIKSAASILENINKSISGIARRIAG